MLNARTESFGFSAISSIIYNDSPNVYEEMARKCINVLIMAGADVDVSDYRGIYLIFNPGFLISVVKNNIDNIVTRNILFRSYAFSNSN